MLTENITIPLEAEQSLVFQGIEDEERRILDHLKPVQQKRNDMVTVLLAGKGLLRAVQDTPGVKIDVTPAGGIVITVPPTPDIQPAED